MHRLIYTSTRPFVCFLQASVLICSSSPFPSAAPVPANGAVFEFIEVVVPGVWSAAFGVQVPASGDPAHRAASGPNLSRPCSAGRLRGAPFLALFSLVKLLFCVHGLGFVGNLVFQT